MLYTSYFSMIRNFPKCMTPLSISQYPPAWYEGKGVKSLAPSKELLSGYKNGEISEDEYKAEYNSYLENKVNAQWVKNGLLKTFENTKDGKPIWESETDHAAFVCFEKPGDFCHRHLLAEHLTRLGLPTREVSKEELISMKTLEAESPSIFGISKGIICHQVNCQKVMGAGIALAIKEKFPKVYDDYMFSFEGKAPEKLYGKVKMTEVSNDLKIASIYSQFYYGNPAITGRKYTNEDLLVNGIAGVLKRYPDEPVYIPEKIGCGLGGGDWNLVLSKLKELETDNLYIFNKKEQISRLPHPLSRDDYLIKVIDIAKKGVEDTDRKFLTETDWGYPVPFGLNCIAIEEEESVVRMLKELCLTDKEPDENLPCIIADYLTDRALAHDKQEYLSKIGPICEELEYYKSCYMMNEKENIEEHER